MLLSNGNIYLNGRFVPGGVAFSRIVEAAGPEVTGGTDLAGDYVIPGLIDIHTHGAVGEDAGDGSPQGLEKMARYYAAGGVTAWCPTAATLPEKALTKAMEAVGSFVRPGDGARIAGVHLEGPFLSREKCGAQNPDNLCAPDVHLFRRLNEASGRQVRLVTVAPELPGALPFIREVSKTCAVSLGHTAADYETALAAYEGGASHATHLFNAMPSFHHRKPGVVAAALDAGATVELIPDGLHVHPAVIRLVHRLFGEKLVLVSDSLRCAGMPDGAYELGGLAVTLAGGRGTLRGSDTLAGSSIHLMDGLRRAVSFGVPLEAAVYAATAAPARAIRRDGELGALIPGYAADLVVLDRELNLKAVYIDGEQVR